MGRSQANDTMKCTNCDFDNDAAAAFCEECGSRLAPSCTHCGTELKATTKFCPKCGKPAGVTAPQTTAAPREIAAYTPKHLAEKILNSRSALEGERKQVTVLFADVKQSTELSQAIDIEEWHRILDRFFAILNTGVHRFEGTINQYTGDGVMALFGAPVTHEDDAQRACWTALSLLDDVRGYAQDIRRRHGLDFQIRIGINSGEVVVGRIGDDLRMDYTAQGPVVHVAARTQDLAEAGCAYLAPATAARVAPYFALEDLGEFRIKGLEAPQRLFRLEGTGAASSRFDVARTRGLTSFVGRQHEMTMLEVALEQARAGNGQVVGISAEAGTGKSRLCFEFIEGLRARGLKVLHAGCPSHGRNLPFHPILQVLRSYFGILHLDSPATAREKIAARMQQFGEGFADALPLLFDFLAVSDPEQAAPALTPEARRRRLFALLRESLRHGPEPGQKVGIVVIEDLHWIDDGSDEWIAEWVDATGGAQSLLVLNFRPEYRAAWTHRTHYQQISLSPLSPAMTRDLVGALLGHHRSLTALVERIHSETGGNPFYAEEVVQTLIESGALSGSRGAFVLEHELESLEIPASVQAVLSARIDRLDHGDKDVLQAASVIGKDFAEPLLRDVVAMSEPALRAALERLRDAEFILEQSVYPKSVHTFKHPLTQQVANESLLRDRRADLHRRVASAMETQGQNADEHAALLAHHYVGAGERVVGAGWYLRAAEWIGANDVTASAKHAQAVIDALAGHEDLPGADALLATAAAKLLALRVRIGVLDNADEIHERGSQWASRAGDLATALAISANYANLLLVDGRMDESEAIQQHSRDIAAEIGDQRLLTFTRGYSGFLLVRIGRFEEAESDVGAALAELENDPGYGAQMYGSGLTGLLLMWTAYNRIHTQPWAEANRAIETASRWAENGEETEFAIYTFSILYAARARLAGGAAESVETVREALAMAEEYGAVWPLTVARIALADVLLDNGDDPQEVLSLVEPALHDARVRRIARHYEAELLAATAVAEYRIARPDRAHALMDEAVDKAAPIPLGLLSVLDASARLALAAGRPEECAAGLDRMESISHRIGAVNYAPLIDWRRADLAVVRGEADTARERLCAAHAGFTERGATNHAASVAASLASLT